MLKTLIKTSNFVRLVEKKYLIYSSIELWLIEIYKNSRTNRLIQDLRERIKVIFKYSFLGRITEVKEGENSLVLTESRVLRHIINVYKKYKSKARQYLINSRNYSLAGQIKINPCSVTLKAMAVILMAAVFTNTIFSLLFGQQIELISWIMRGLLLFAGTGALFSNADWLATKENSVILRLVFKNVRDLRKDKL